MDALPRKRLVDKNGLLKRICTSVSKITSRVVIIHGNIPILRWHVAATALVNAYHEQRSIFSTDLNAYIESYFKEEGAVSVRRFASKADVLWIRMDFLRKHAWGESAFSGLICERSTKVTVLTGLIEVQKMVMGIDKALFDVSNMAYEGNHGSIVSCS